jgi:hypothetical protein
MLNKVVKLEDNQVHIRLPSRKIVEYLALALLIGFVLFSINLKVIEPMLDRLGEQDLVSSTEPTTSFLDYVDEYIVDSPVIEEVGSYTSYLTEGTPKLDQKHIENKESFEDFKLTLIAIQEQKIIATIMSDVNRHIPDPKAFMYKLNTIAEELDIDPLYLAIVIHIESKFKPYILNYKGSGAKGFIQFNYRIFR